MNARQRRKAIRRQARQRNLYPHQIKMMQSIRRMAKRHPMPTICWPSRFGKTFVRGQLIDHLIVVPKPEVQITQEVTMRQLKQRLEGQYNIVLADEAHIVDDPNTRFTDVPMPANVREAIIETPVRPDELNHHG